MPTESFRRAMAEASIETDAALHADGRLHRFHVTGEAKGSRNGFYILFPDEPMAGSFGTWKQDGPGAWHKWSAKPERTFSTEERRKFKLRMKQVQQEREEEQARIHAKARDRAAQIWGTALPATGGHPYTQKKAVGLYGVKFESSTRQEGAPLLVPVRDSIGTLHGFQRIFPDGAKRYLPGTAKVGCYHSIGAPEGKIYICEGYATGASIHEATGGAVAIAFDAGNLCPVAEAMRAKYPGLQVVLCADNDAWTEGNPGQSKATEAARAVNALLAVPAFKDTANKPTDFNDLHQREGLEVVRRQIEAAQQVEVDRALEVIRGCDVRPEKIKWLWDTWLPAGKLVILAGAPGTGKTTIAINLGAILTSGGRWPDGEQSAVADVAMWSGEDDPQDTLVPRFIAAGADMRRVHLIRAMKEAGHSRPFDPSCDMGQLSAYLQGHPQIKILIVDPVVSAVSGDSHKNTEVRRSLQPLVDLGAKHGCTVLGISHFSKGTGGRDPVERITGSIAFGALARLVLAAAKLADDEDDKRLFVRAKSNIGPDSGGWHYKLDTTELPDYMGVITSRVTWCGGVEGSARKLLDTADTLENSEERGARGDARKFLLEMLGGGAASAKSILDGAKNNGIAPRTLNRAKKDLDIHVTKTGMGGGWEWALPPNIANSAEECQQNLTATFGEGGNLRPQNNDHNRIPKLTVDDFYGGAYGG